MDSFFRCIREASVILSSKKNEINANKSLSVTPRHSYAGSPAVNFHYQRAGHFYSENKILSDKYCTLHHTGRSVRTS